MPTFQPGASGDDGRDWNASGFTVVGAEELLGEDATVGYRNFFRFPSVTVPQGATITAASVQFDPRWSDSGTVVNLDLYFNNVDNATAPTTTGELDTRFGAVTAAVAWDAVPAWTADTPNADTTTPSLVSILQTVINRAGWASGNALLLLIDGTRTTASVTRRPKSFDNGAGLPTLTITYTTVSTTDGKILIAPVGFA